LPVKGVPLGEGGKEGGLTLKVISGPAKITIFDSTIYFYK